MDSKSLKYADYYESDAVINIKSDMPGTIPSQHLVYYNAAVVILLWLLIMAFTIFFKNVYTSQEYGREMRMHLMKLTSADLVSALFACVVAYWLCVIVADSEDVMMKCVDLFGDKWWILMLLLAMVMTTFLFRFLVYYMLASGFLLTTNNDGKLLYTDAKKAKKSDRFLQSAIAYAVVSALIFISLFLAFHFGSLEPQGEDNPGNLQTQILPNCILVPKAILGRFNQIVFCVCVIQGLLASHVVVDYTVKRKEIANLKDPVMKSDYITTSLNSCVIGWGFMVLVMWFYGMHSMIYVLMWSYFCVVDCVLQAVMALIMGFNLAK